MNTASDKNLQDADAESGHEEITVDNGSPQTETQGAADVLGPGVDGVDEAVVQQVKRHVAQIRETMKRTVEAVWELGRALRAAKQQIPHGQWIPWLQSRIGIPVRTAQRAMALYDRYPEMRQVWRFDTVTAAMRALPPIRSPANQGKRASIATGETISVQPTTETNSAAQPTQGSASNTEPPAADAPEPAAPDAATETGTAAQPAQESASNTEPPAADAPEPAAPDAATETGTAAQPAQESASDTEPPTADAPEPSAVEATTETGTAAQPAQESASDTERANATAGETSRAEATTETTVGASSAYEPVDEQERAGIDADEPVVTPATTGGAEPAAAERAVARDDRTLETLGEDLATVVSRLEFVLYGTPARAVPQRESDLRALRRLVRVLAEAILRHLDRPGVSEKNTGDLPDEFVRVMHEAIQKINNRRGVGSRFGPVRRWLGTR